jgi:hypothetical protein
MMTAGEIKSLTTHLATMRDDWPQHQIIFEVNKLAEEGYSVVDLTAACAEVAASKQYAPAILAMVVPELIAERHAQPGKPKRRRRYRPDETRLCDICTKPEVVCQSTAANLGTLRDHDFISVEEAERQRAAARNPKAAIAEADLFTMPEDV